ncbi:related to short-chain dehydrogenase/reductase family protein, putative-Penicillium marneffei [Serendipita indica DSM 11827]|uniref:Related to short-chain dehydrogenase/reductase family protein, putative-Penicillium marneffei n=1 Tax=Serendipita indica (strain DSM 11827) TaxID=1109443 RepID=G4TND8_SERID|nr:related to short-chain dehydrogenase/reductase family protein, putative-Penicillium marneffei [Serendipita indica DSM 11827]
MAFAVLSESFANKWFPGRGLPETIVDLTGRTVIVTGSNVGLGFETAKAFYQMNPARLILAVRSVDKGEAAKKKIVEEGGVTVLEGSRPRVDVWHLDMADFANVKKFAQRCHDELDRIDIFLANAGVQNREWIVTKDSWEVALQTNVISTYLLTLLVTDKLVQTAKLPAPKAGVIFKPHLVIVASDVHYMASLNDRKEANIFQALNREDRFDGAARYQDSKLIEVLLTRFLAKQSKFSLESTGVVMCTVNPGLCYSELGRFMKGPMAIAKAIFFALFARTTEEGAKNFTWACLNNDIPQGAYTSSCRVTTPSNFVLSQEGDQVSEKLWDELVTILNEIAPEKQSAWTL